MDEPVDEREDGWKKKEEGGKKMCTRDGRKKRGMKDGC